MADMVIHRNGTAVLVVPEKGPALSDPAEFTQLIGDAMGNDADVVAIPVTRLAEEFFQLRTGLAGEVTQKFVNYRLRLAVVGDVSHHTSASTALSAFVAEANRGRQLWFVADEVALNDRLG